MKRGGLKINGTFICYILDINSFLSRNETKNGEDGKSLHTPLVKQLIKGTIIESLQKNNHNKEIIQSNLSTYNLSSGHFCAFDSNANHSCKT